MNYLHILMYIVSVLHTLTHTHARQVVVINAAEIFEFLSAISGSLEDNSAVPEHNVTSATNITFPTLLKENLIVAAYFHSPWDPMGSHATQHFRLASSMISTNDDGEDGDDENDAYLSPNDFHYSVKFVDINVQEYDDMRKLYDVDKTPKVKLFMDGQFVRDMESHSARHLVADLSDVLHQTHTLKTKEKTLLWLKLANSTQPTAFCLFPSETKDLEHLKEHRHAFRMAVRHTKGMVAAEIRNDAARDEFFKAINITSLTYKYGIEIVMVMPFDEKVVVFDEEPHTAPLVRWLRLHNLPSISIFNTESAERIFEDGRAVTFLLYSEEDEAQKAAELELRKVSMQFREKAPISLAHVGTRNGHNLLGTLNVDSDDLKNGPMLIIVAYTKIENSKLPVQIRHSVSQYRFTGELKAANLLQFHKQFMDGTLEKYVRSEPEPTDQSGPVFVLVGRTLPKYLLNVKDPLLVLYYAPWCGFCHQFHPIYLELSKELRRHTHVLPAKIDIAQNDIPSRIDGVPTVTFYPKGDYTNMWDRLADAVEYSGSREVPVLINWIKQQLQPGEWSEEAKEVSDSDDELSELVYAEL